MRADLAPAIDGAAFSVRCLPSGPRNLRGPTTTAMDRTAVDYLAHVANVPDVDAFADEMFRAKSNMDGLDIHEVRGAVRPGAAFACTRGLICNGALVICVPPGVIQIVSTDYKQFSMVGTKLGFGVVETIHPQEMIDRKVRWASVGWIPFLGRERSPGAFDWIALPQMEILDGIRALKAQDRNDLMFFAIVDVINLKSVLLGATEEEVRAAPAVPHEWSKAADGPGDVGEVLRMPHPGADCGRGVQRAYAEPAPVRRRVDGVAQEGLYSDPDALPAHRGGPARRRDRRLYLKRVM